MGLFGRNTTTVGLDIGSGLIKLVVIDHSKAQPEIAQVVTSPLVPDAIVEGEIMDPVLVADTIRSLLQSVGLKGKRVVAAATPHFWLRALATAIGVTAIGWYLLATF